MKVPSSFFGATARAMLPLVLWALHFAFSYVAVALGCTAGWHRAAAGGLSLLQWVLAAGSTAAIAAIAALIHHDCRLAAYTRHSLISQVRAITGLIALLGIVWASAPPFLLSACHFTDQQPLKAATWTRTFPTQQEPGGRARLHPPWRHAPASPPPEGPMPGRNQYRTFPRPHPTAKGQHSPGSTWPPDASCP